MDFFSEPVALCLFAFAISAVKMGIGFFFGWLAYRSGEEASKRPPTK